MENRKGSGIFLGVVGVATLVVAIIGATFAYFSATASNDNAITGSTGAAGGLTLAIEKVTDTNSNLIPLNLHTGDTAGVDTTDQFSQAMTGSCKDGNESNVCVIYKITITNTSTTNAVKVVGNLNLTATDVTNMKWMQIDSNKAKLTDNQVQNSTGTAKPLTTSNGTTETELSLNASGTQDYYVLVWLEEMGEAQEDNDADGSYTGTVTFNAVGANGMNGVTATFNS